MNLLDMRNRRELVKVLHKESGAMESKLNTSDGGKWSWVEGGSQQKIIVKRLVNKPFALMASRSAPRFLLGPPSIIEEEYSQQASFARLDNDHINGQIREENDSSDQLLRYVQISLNL